MSLLLDFNEKFLWTPTNPENIVDSPKGGWFFRRYHKFYVNTSGDFDGSWYELPYKTVILPRWPPTRLIRFQYDMELWFKTSNGFVDQYGVLHPKVGWQFYAYNVDAFYKQPTQVFSWIFPPPTSSYDPSGVNNNRSYDQDYFYTKINGLWYRTPIAIWTDTTPTDPGEVPYWYSNLPFVDRPRKAPRPIATTETGLLGQQSYDYDYFYIDVSAWKRSPLILYEPPPTMTMF